MDSVTLRRVGFTAALSGLAYLVWRRLTKKENAGPLRVSKLFVYPIKSCRGYECSQAEFDRLGFLFDRRFCLVDDTGLFLSARQFPKMALLKPSFEDHDGATVLVINGPDLPTLRVHIDATQTDQKEIKIWDDRFAAKICADASVNDALSEFLGRKCFLASLAENHTRTIQDTYIDFDNKDNVSVGFGDGFPFLLVSEASFRAVQRACPRPITLEHFRPNIIVEGCTAFDEDTWKTFTIGNNTFHNAKPCDRCSLTTVNPETGVKDKSGQPLLTLRKMRSQPNSDFGKPPEWWSKRLGRPLFGVNILQEKAAGQVKTGALIQVHERFGPYVAPSSE